MNDVLKRRIAMEHMEKPLTEKDRRHNYNCYAADCIFFNVGNAFFEPNSIIPAFLSQLTDSNILIGLSSTIRNCGWFLPQLFVANYVQGMVRKKPLGIICFALMRFSAGALAITAFLLAGKHPSAALLIFYLFYIVFSFADGFSGVPWVDIMGKTIPPGQRGRLLATSQFIGGGLAFGAGFFIKGILESPKLTFPINYGIIFLTGFTALMVSFVSFSLVKEPPSRINGRKMGYKEYFRWILDIFLKDRNFARVIGVSFMTRAMFLSLPFYVIFARNVLMFPQDIVGYFVSAQMIGYLISSHIWGYLSDNLSNKRVITLTGVSAAATPCLALIAAAGFNLGIDSLLIPIYLLLYISIGFTITGMWTGYNNYLLEITGDENRAVYVGLYNTMGTPATFFPLLGGFIIQHFSYVYVFLFTAILISIGTFLSTFLKDRADEE
jgi:MFS family permease